MSRLSSTYASHCRSSLGIWVHAFWNSPILACIPTSSPPTSVQCISFQPSMHSLTEMYSE